MTASDETIEAAASIRDLFERLRLDLAALGKDLSHLAEVAAATGQDKLSAEITRFKGNAEQLFGTAKEQAQSSGEDFEALVKRYPIASVAGAFGAGLVIASLLNRSR